MDNGIYVCMPVKCIGKICKNCPNLHIDTSVFNDIESGDFEIDLKCRGLNRCLRIYNMIEKEKDHDRSHQEP